VKGLPPAGRWVVGSGSPTPLGATWVEAHQAYNFALYSRHATGVTLLCYREAEPATPVFRYPLDYLVNKTGRIWHCWVPANALQGATLYGYAVDGPWELGQGHRFDADKVVLDPYATEIYFPPGYSREACSRPGPTDGRAPLGVLPTSRFVARWDADTRPRHGHDTVIYELHVKGFTARANSGITPEQRGTFAGIVQKIPYLLDLGVTVVELLPVHQFDPLEGNYWGYMTLNFFSPHRQYAVREPLQEFRELVDQLHAAGLQVWLDVVYNHSSEGDESGPTYSFRGIDNRSYYLLSPDGSRYWNDTGCGNTIRSGNAAMRRLVVESLFYWSRVMGADAFRFDLASILTRNNDGSINLEDPPLIDSITMSGILNHTALIAEAWDVGSYQLGRTFPGLSWLQWNGYFRDDVRAFVRGDVGKVGALALRLYGSDDLFPDTLGDAYRPFQSINFITAHDGYTLYDLVSYNVKHNWANGHDNTDGNDYNLSWNCGWEGDAHAPDAVLALRRRQVKNFCCLLMLANGTPMIVAGDEFLQTQGGNNNPYNQDNLTTWLDWDLLDRNRDVYRFFQLMIAFRKTHPSIARRTFWRNDVHWYGMEGAPDWGPEARTLAYSLLGASARDDDLYVMINAGSADQTFTIEEGTAADWLRVVDTSRPSPDDIVAPGSERALTHPQYQVMARSVVVLRRPQDTSHASARPAAGEQNR
jgi:isoamylase